MDISSLRPSQAIGEGRAGKNAEIPIELGEKSLFLKVCVGQNVNYAFFKSESVYLTILWPDDNF